MSLLVTICRIALGALLVVAGALKLGHSTALAAAIASFRILPEEAVAPLAVVLPFFEIIVGLYLLAGLFTRVAALVAAVQFAIYGGAIASAVMRAIPANCGCFGPNDQVKADWPHVIFDLLLAALCAFVAYGAPGFLALDRKIRT
jgi:uncharacterized membrane protein YphA (DoxX/SURF4 family)